MITKVFTAFLVTVAVICVAAILYVNGTLFYMIASKTMPADMRSHIIDAKLVVEKKIEVMYKVSIGSKMIVNNKELSRYRPIPHPLFHYALITTKNFLGLSSYEVAWWYTMMISQIATLILTTYLVHLGAPVGIVGWSIAVILSSILLITSSIYMPWFLPKMYLGFLNGNLYHNSTSIVAKPIAFILLIVLTKWLKNTNQSLHYIYAIITTIVVVISALAKPNIPMAIIPAWVLLIGYLFLKDQQRTIQFYTPYVIPVIIVLAVMYTQSQVRFNSVNSYGIQWWYVAQHWTPNPFISLVLTILFPLVMLVLYPQMLNDKLFFITFISLIIAVLTYWTFYETTKTFSNNFGWGARMMVNALFAVSVAHLIRVYRSVSTRSDIIRLVIVTGVLIAHIVSGIMYILEMYQSKTPFI